MNNTCAASPLHIPEILERVLSFLSDLTLRHTASYVCRQWYQTSRILIVTTASFSAMRPPDGQNRVEFLKRLAIAKDFTCERGSHPNYYVPPQPLGLEEKSWAALLEDLAALSRSSAGLKIRSFTLYSDWDSRTWSTLVPFLGILGPNLISLRLDRMSLSATVPLFKILELCPTLKHLFLASFEDMYWHKGTQLEEPNAELDSTPRTWVLETCTFENMILTDTALEPFVKACPELRELRLVCIPPDSSSVRSIPDSCIFFKPEARAAFYRRLSSYCPKLKSFHISLSDRMTLPAEVTKDLVPFQELPLLESWSLSPKVLSTETFHSLNALGSEHRLSSLEIIGNHGGFTTTREAQHGQLLHAFMCQSPSLLHVKASGINLPLESLQAPQTRIWACRKLVTLHARVDGRFMLGPQKEEQHRIVYGYVARVCPRLQELHINQPGEMMRLASGMCLLSRIKDLRRLRLIMTEWPSTCCIDDLDWIRPYYVKGTVPPHPFEAFIRCVFKRKSAAKFRFVTLAESSLTRMIKENRNKSDTKAAAPTTGMVAVTAGVDDANQEEDDTLSKGCMVDGVDMRYLGQLEDVQRYFGERLAHPHECLWPELEALEIRYKYLNTSLCVDNMPFILSVMKNERKHVHVDAKKLTQHM
ncbi:hypothetical protein BGX31_007281 [Mortierella sp. GBA43]|nr:hypothetical protein BGX31_007281 [Mortierella sp. GBA43]